jgi:RNA polymerase sigma factor (sigma-70 family)
MSPVTATADTDEELARRADVAALYGRYSRRLLAFLAGLGLTAADADDVHQETWARAVTALRRSPFEGTFRGWLFQVARNAAIDLARKKRPGSLSAEAADSVIGDDPPPDQLLIDADYQARLERCVGRLPEPEAAVVRGRLAGDGYEAVAARLGVATERAHKLFFLAKQALAACLGA